MSIVLNIGYNITLNTGNVYLITSNNNEYSKLLRQCNSHVFNTNNFSPIKYDFDRSILDYFGIYFMPFRYVFRRMKFSKSEANKTLIKLKYYLDLELQRKRCPLYERKKILKKYTLGRNACAISNTAKIILMLLLSEKRTNIFFLDYPLSPDNVLTAYQVLRDQVENTEKIAFVFNSFTLESSVCIDKLDDRNIKSILSKRYKKDT